MSDIIVINDSSTKVIATDTGATVVQAATTPTVLSVGIQGPAGPAGPSATSNAIAYAIALG